MEATNEATRGALRVARLVGERKERPHLNARGADAPGKPQAAGRPVSARQVERLAERPDRLQVGLVALVVLAGCGGAGNAAGGGGDAGYEQATGGDAKPVNLDYGLQLSGGTQIRAPLVGMTAEGVGGVTADNEFLSEPTAREMNESGLLGPPLWYSWSTRPATFDSERVTPFS